MNRIYAQAQAEPAPSSSFVPARSGPAARRRSGDLAGPGAGAGWDESYRRGGYNFGRLQVLHEAAGALVTIRPQLQINVPGDASEREADLVADVVTSMPAQHGPAVSGRSPQVRRRSAGCGESNASRAPVSADLAARIDGLEHGGQPLGTEDRAFFEPRLGRDLGPVRIHADAPAADSARALDANAFTVGHHIVFAAGRYTPRTPAGRRLLAHELGHVAQQDGSIPPGTIQRQPSGTVDVELAPVPPTEAERLRQQGVRLPAVSGQTWAAIGGSPYSSILPGYSQLGDTCGAASVVSALVIWDREHWDAARPNDRVVTACNLILTELARRGEESVGRWVVHPARDVTRTCGGDPACIRQAYVTLRQQLAGELRRIRDSGRQPGARISEDDYQKLGLTLYFLWHEGGQAGLSAAEIQGIQNAVGLGAHDARASGNVQSFEDIFTQSIITGLQPDQFAQVAWFVNTGRQHAFLLGRLQSGEWFLSDQGTLPATEFRAAALPELRNAVHTAAASGSYWLFVGTTADYMSRYGILPGWTGVRRLGPQTGVESQAQNVVPPGAFLGEMDAGPSTIGDRLTRDAFVSRHYSLSDAQSRYPASTGGGLIVEMPLGVFSLYTTSAVSEANLSETSLDAEDSRGGVLARRSFFHAWLLLGTTGGRRGAWFTVY